MHVWNRTPARANRLVEELISLGAPAEAKSSVSECVKDADVIITATYASSPLVSLSMVKPNVHINGKAVTLTNFNKSWYTH